jgi:hypothetical protein
LKIYPLNPEEEKLMKEFIDEHLTKGTIQKSSSPQAFPFFFVDKKDGKKQPCQDYRYMNGRTVKNAYLLPLVSNLLDNLKGAKHFTKVPFVKCSLINSFVSFSSSGFKG